MRFWGATVQPGVRVVARVHLSMTQRKSTHRKVKIRTACKVLSSYIHVQNTLDDRVRTKNELTTLNTKFRAQRRQT